MKTVALIMSSLLCISAAYADEIPKLKKNQTKLLEKNYDGFVSMGYGMNSGTLLDFDVKGSFYNTQISLQKDLVNNYGFQLDGIYQSNYNNISISDTDLNINPLNKQLSLHTYWRDSSKGLAGIFGQYSNNEIYETFTNKSYNITELNKLIGVEGQYFFKNLTIYSQLAYQQLETDYYGGQLNSQGAIVNVEFRYFILPNLLTSLHFEFDKQYLTTDSTDYNYNTYNIGFKSEYKFHKSNFSLFSNIDYLNYNIYVYGNNINMQNNYDIMFGVKYNIDEISLYERDKSGASLNSIKTVRPLISNEIPAG